MASIKFYDNLAEEGVTEAIIALERQAGRLQFKEIKITPTLPKTKTVSTHPRTTVVTTTPIRNYGHMSSISYPEITYHFRRSTKASTVWSATTSLSTRKRNSSDQPNCLSKSQTGFHNPVQTSPYDRISNMPVVNFSPVWKSSNREILVRQDPPKEEDEFTNNLTMLLACCCPETCPNQSAGAGQFCVAPPEAYHIPTEETYRVMQAFENIMQ